MGRWPVERSLLGQGLCFRSPREWEGRCPVALSVPLPPAPVVCPGRAHGACGVPWQSSRSHAHGPGGLFILQMRRCSSAARLAGRNGSPLRLRRLLGHYRQDAQAGRPLRAGGRRGIPGQPGPPPSEPFGAPLSAVGSLGGGEGSEALGPCPTGVRGLGRAGCPEPSTGWQRDGRAQERRLPHSPAPRVQSDLGGWSNVCRGPLGRPSLPSVQSLGVSCWDPCLLGVFFFCSPLFCVLWGESERRGLWFPVCAGAGLSFGGTGATAPCQPFS